MSLAKVSAALLASAILAAAPAAARTPVPFSFNFASANANNNVSNGNARFFSATSQQWGTFNVRATAWSLERTTNGSVFVRDSKLMVYSNGLGVISDDDGNGSSNRHTIDNQNRADFILLQFDRRVALTSATLNAYSLGGATDTDAMFSYGDTPIQWNSSLQLDNQPLSRLTSMFSGSFTSLGTNASGRRTINEAGRRGDLWMIGADAANADRRIDAFKLAGLTAVPEPATWAMMIGGFGLVGAVARRRSSPAVTFA